MSERKREHDRSVRLHNAISRLAKLFPYGELLASTEPDALLNSAADEIERLRAERTPSNV